MAKKTFRQRLLDNKNAQIALLMADLDILTGYPSGEKHRAVVHKWRTFFRREEQLKPIEVVDELWKIMENPNGKDQ